MIKKLVMVIEDDAGIREGLRELLQFEGYLALAVCNGQEAVDALGALKETSMPSLIFLDLMMPVMTGPEFLVVKNANPIWAKIPLVTISAAPKQGSGKLPGVSEEIKKPVEIDTLVSLLTKYC